MLIINGSIRGASGNSGRIVEIVQTLVPADEYAVLTLAEAMPTVPEVKRFLQTQKSFLVVTGNYWSSWGSSLQRFLEVVTAYENTSVFFGKPVACVVSMDSVGGADVAARLHGAFSGLGCWSPPCSTVIISRVAQEAIAASQGQPDDPNEDVWRPSDLNILVSNLIKSQNMIQPDWQRWPNVEFESLEGPWPNSGPLDYGTEPFI